MHNQCLPQVRQWPGRRCDRCQKYNYICSANKTKEEQDAVSDDAAITETQGISPIARSSPNAPPLQDSVLPFLPGLNAESSQESVLPSMTGINAEITQDSPLPTIMVIRAETIRKLQVFADLRQLKSTAGNVHVFDPSDLSADCYKAIVKRSDVIETELRTQAEQSTVAGSYQDAIYIYSYILGQFGVSHTSMRVKHALESTSMLVKLYDGMGNFAAAEKLQEQIVDNFEFFHGYEASPEDRFSREIDHLVSLYARFCDRLKDLDLEFAPPPSMADLAKLTVFRRAVSLEIDKLSDKVLSSPMIGLAPSPLHFAARTGAADMVGILLNKFNYSINTQNENGSTALHEAIVNDQPEILEILLERNADLNILTVDGEMPLHSAIRTASLECTRILLDRCGSAQIHAKDDWGRAALHLAVDSASEDVVRMILGAGASLEDRDAHGETALQTAVYLGNNDLIALLLDAGASIEVTDTDGMTLLHCAVETDNEGMVALLLEAGVSIEARNVDEMTALMAASRQGSLPIVQRLLRKGADLESRNDVSGLTPFLIATAEGTAAMVTFLMTKCANVRARDKSGQTALHIAARRYLGEEDERVLLTLLENRFDRDATDDYGVTPLCRAASLGSLTEARILLDHGASPDISDKDRKTPLHKAAEFGHDSLVSLLIRKGANVEVRDVWSRTPLWMAASRGHVTSLRVLLESGAHVEAIDDGDETPLAVAVRSCTMKIVGILLECGANVKYVPSRKTDEGVEGDTLLHIATRNCDTAIAELLLNAGADVNAKNSSDGTPLHLAMWKLSRCSTLSAHFLEQTVGVLLEHGALLHIKDNWGETPLYHAAKLKNVTVVRMMLKAVLENASITSHFISIFYRSALDNLYSQLTHNTEVRDEKWRDIEAIMAKLSYYLETSPK